jgi:hypothetical protein
MTAVETDAAQVAVEDPAVIGGESHGELYPPGGQGMYELEFIPWLVGFGLAIGLLVIGVMALRRSLRRRRR